MMPLAGVGLAWRPETAWLIECRADLQFSEVLVENLDPSSPPAALARLQERGVSLIPHGVSLSLGGAEAPEAARLERLARLATALKAPFVSEHVAFVRAGDYDSGHLLPVPRTREALDILVENVEHAVRRLPVPLVLENIAAQLEWPENEFSEAEFLRILFERTGTQWLLDASNLYANVINHRWDLDAFLAQAPLDRVAYVHVAGGIFADGVYHDTHAHALGAGPLAVLEQILRLTGPVPVLVERDRNFGGRGEHEAELNDVARIVAACRAGAAEARPDAW